MHTYLKSIGFRKRESQQDVEALVRDSVMNAESNQSLFKSNGLKYVEYRKTYAENIGITVRGEEDEKGVFHVGNYNPYLTSTSKLIQEDEILVHKKVDSDAFTGMCDDNRLGVSLIFYIQNIADFIKEGKAEIVLKKKKIRLSALADNGKIILPTQKRIYSHIQNKIENVLKNQLMDDAKNGDIQALDYLAMDDRDKSEIVMERIKHEDLFSIVETCFIPYGSESDLYYILANIVLARQLQNPATGELLWVLRLVCNDVEFDTVINSEDLLGFPSPGMRFRGIIWMQGEVETN